jgi:steroid 5-alpha reductase family enzyme
MVGIALPVPPRGVNMSSSYIVLPATFAITLAIMCSLWLASLKLRDVSIVDLNWGPGFAVIAWVAWYLGEGGVRATLVVALATLWGTRLGAYLFIRNRGKPEDYRYAAMRRRHGDRFATQSLFTVFLLQGVLMWIVSLPLQAIQVSGGTDLNALDFLGVALFALGFVFESVGDYQLAKFKAVPGNTGKVMDRGLWGWTRHPNYFGDFTLWWGFGALALAVGSYWTLVGPLVMSIFLMRISGAALLEKGLRKSKPKYAEYEASTSAFFPFPPRKKLHAR